MLRPIHRWLAYLIAGPFLIISLTGCLLLLRAQLEPWLAPDLYAITAGTPTANAIRDALVAYAPDRSPQLVRLPADGAPIIVRLSGEPRLEVFIDPGSLAILGTRDPQNAPTTVILDLHRRLMLGKTGDWIGGIVAILLSATLISGAWLWWRGPRRWQLAIRPQHRCFDLHRLLGVVGLPLMLLIAFTGIGLAFPDATRAVFRQPPRAARMADVPNAPKPPKASKLDWDAIVSNANLADPSLIMFPRRGGEPLNVRDRSGASVQLEPSTLAVTSRKDGRELSGWILALHSGEVGAAGLPLWLATGLSLFTLLVSGLLLRIHRACGG